MYEGEFFSNVQNNKVLDVSGGKDEEHRSILVWKRHGGKNQRWKVLYVDQDDKADTKGLNKEFGFEINRPFYLRSRLPMKRVVECIGANNLTLKKWRKNTAA